MVEFLSTVRIGQISGSTGDTWPSLVDAQGWPLLNDIGRRSVKGFDEGANTEHNGRIYFFTGDVNPQKRNDRTPLNSDLVVWTDETRILRHGGPLSIGWLHAQAPVGLSGATSRQ